MNRKEGESLHIDDLGWQHLDPYQLRVNVRRLIGSARSTIVPVRIENSPPPVEVSQTGEDQPKLV